ncbi:glycoside hydrolase family 28 [Alicyclobacillus hesperidum URH17-3-68]|nr:glycoside hydrolase family 28 [Alicyclobacillus hesperidum URH17-3-68]
MGELDVKRLQRKHMRVMGALMSASVVLGLAPAMVLADTPSKLVSAPVGLQSYAVTSSLVDLIWQPEYNAGVTYAVYENGSRIGRVADSNFTVSDLQPNHTYSFQVATITGSGDVSKPSAAIVVKTLAQGKMVNVKQFGAIGDGKSDDTRALQRAIDAVPKGGTLYVPAGTYYTAPLQLKSDMTLYLAKGATLLGSSNIDAYKPIWSRWEGTEMYRYMSLITGDNVRNVTITGEGVIDGNGETPIHDNAGNTYGNWWSKQYKEPLSDPAVSLVQSPNYSQGLPYARPSLIEFLHSQNILIQGVTVQNSPSWTIHPVYCDHVTLADVHIVNPPTSDNTDGVDPDSVNGMQIIDDTFSVGDDDIAIKSGKDAEGRRIGIPSQNIVVRNCHMLNGHGVSIGSEMSGGVQNVLVENCDFDGTNAGLRIKTLRGRGGIVQNITFDHVSMSNIQAQAFIIDENYASNGSALPPGPVTDATPAIRNLNFDNITVNGAKQAMYFSGLAELPIQNIAFHNVAINGAGSGIQAENVEGVKMDNVSINGVPMFDGVNTIQDLTFQGILPSAATFLTGTQPIALPGNLVTNVGGTISASFASSADTGVNMPIVTGEGTNGNGVGVFFNADHRVEFQMHAGSQSVDLVSPQAYHDGLWHQVTATWDNAGDANLYIDGSLVASTTVAPATTVDGDPTVASPQVNPVAIASSMAVGGTTDASFMGQIKDVTIMNYPESPLSISGYHITNVSGGGVVSPEGLQVDAQQYNNRPYTFTWVPPYLIGDPFLQTTAGSRSGLSFDLHQDATVYVAYDATAKKPTWLKPFVDTGETLSNDVGETYEIYAKDFAAGEVSLGPVVDPKHTAMYTVFVGQGLPTTYQFR